MNTPWLFSYIYNTFVHLQFQKRNILLNKIFFFIYFLYYTYNISPLDDFLELKKKETFDEGFLYRNGDDIKSDKHTCKRKIYE